MPLPLHLLLLFVTRITDAKKLLNMPLPLLLLNMLLPLLVLLKLKPLLLKSLKLFTRRASVIPSLFLKKPLPVPL
ncbi:uncharacterized protein B0P05DRAFT_547768 [Gilbertella persicaria]|uniref:uncharacterized protein n=1 Tax=Gilbertella persicaria TaxID=101096 RepID=UPI00222103F0|nr:uncharacterized protein B0P05DRAFT_547768 [Gilbertella persicaria]KAI8074222.1 hypothetical protein B0P05DRAFT_547768 [Gilbertella persicaria]